ncbi:MAG: P-type conjugative transfer protein TrbG [Candidatus Thiodiazotropha sp. (ex Dulcina madagascariensis)]|nr:P-type conjugative transfer protein TrbG [Candidatus Thiodiazotropha sp. (ex Dulcina madagascariensis)]
MHKIIHAMIMGAALVVPSYSPAAGSTTDMAEKFFSKKNPKLTKQEKAAIDIAKRWSAGKPSGMRPVVGADGSVRFPYGVQQPSIVCAVLQVCDIALQPGEQVNPNGIHLGDQVRWSVEPAISGSGSNERLHLIVKPWDVGLETTLVVATDRRTYHIRLRSHRSEYMPKVSFAYPEEAFSKWETIRIREKQEKEERTIPQTGEYLGNLDFEYDVDGTAPWKPVRVYSDGRKTIIQMSKVMSQTEAPSLLVLRKEGGWFSEDDVVLVNYRVQGDRFIVDMVFEKAILIAGVGSDQDRITVTRRHGP